MFTDEKVDEDLALVVIVEVEDSLECDYTDCTDAPSWSAKCQQCAALALVCTPHRSYIDNMQRHQGVRIVCDNAHLFPRPIQWLPL